MLWLDLECGKNRDDKKEHQDGIICHFSISQFRPGWLYPIPKKTKNIMKSIYYKNKRDLLRDGSVLA